MARRLGGLIEGIKLDDRLVLPTDHGLSQRLGWRLSVGTNEAFSAFIPTPRHVVPGEVDASNPPVDAVERNVIDLAVENAAARCGKANSGVAFHARTPGDIRLIQPEQRIPRVSQGGDAPEAPRVAQKRP